MKQDTSSTPVKVIEGLDVKNLVFKRRKIPSKRLKEYTDPSGKKFKLNDPCIPNPLRPYEKNEFNTFNKWLAGMLPNMQFIDLAVGDGDISWFFKLKTRGTWLDDKVFPH